MVSPRVVTRRLLTVVDVGFDRRGGWGEDGGNIRVHGHMISFSRERGGGGGRNVSSCPSRPAWDSVCHWLSSPRRRRRPIPRLCMLCFVACVFFFFPWNLFHINPCNCCPTPPPDTDALLVGLTKLHLVTHMSRCWDDSLPAIHVLVSRRTTHSQKKREQDKRRSSSRSFHVHFLCLRDSLSRRGTRHKLLSRPSLISAGV